MSLEDNDFVEIDPKKLGGTPVFRGTRVPIQNLIDCFETGESLDQFLRQYPTVDREAASAVWIYASDLGKLSVEISASHVEKAPKEQTPTP